MRTLFLLLIVSVVSADTLCLKSTLRKNGKIKNKVKVAEQCPKGFTPLFTSNELTGDSLVTIEGPPGPQGPKGDTGSSGTADLKLYYGYSDTSDSTSPKTATAQCGTGYKSIGAGGGGVLAGLGVPYNGPVAISYSGMPPVGDFYYIRAYETTSTSDTWFLMSYILCRPL